mgnify:CR=1 FL=1
MQRALSNKEYLILLKEAQCLVGNRLDKVYEVGQKKFRLDFGKTSLIVYLGKYFYLTKNPPPAPQNPPSFAMYLRKHLCNKLLDSFSQHENDRLYEMKFSNGLTLVFEQFAQGNAFVLGGEMDILMPYSYAPTSAKKYVVGQKFQWPVQKIGFGTPSAENEIILPEGNSTYSEFVEKLASLEETEKAPAENPKLKKLKHRFIEQEKALQKLDLEILESSKIANWMEGNLSTLEEKLEEASRKGEKKLKIKIGRE